jgi:hypothetical protein
MTGSITARRRILRLICCVPLRLGGVDPELIGRSGVAKAGIARMRSSLLPISAPMSGMTLVSVCPS